MGRYLGEFAASGLINIAGGCCGNTPEHIAAIAKALEHQAPRAFGRTPIRPSLAVSA
jgi:5-methyltetrahydrofolate--homocysteine methyltransferase